MATTTIVLESVFQHVDGIQRHYSSRIVTPAPRMSKRAALTPMWNEQCHADMQVAANRVPLACCECHAPIDYDHIRVLSNIHFQVTSVKVTDPFVKLAIIAVCVCCDAAACLATAHVRCARSFKTAVDTYTEMGISKRRTCKNCNVTDAPDGPKLKQCSRCRLAYYCSPECSTCDWPMHKGVCKAIEKDIGESIEDN